MTARLPSAESLIRKRPSALYCHSRADPKFTRCCVKQDQHAYSSSNSLTWYQSFHGRSDSEA
jgi:hypothetical protein